MVADTRKTVLYMLDETVRKERLSHLVLADTFAGIDLSDQEKAFVSRLYAGTLERAIFLDYIIDSHCDNPKKIKPQVRNILRMSIYQMLFMDSVPDHAALNEAGRLCVAAGKKQLKGFVNAVLRSIQKTLAESDITNKMPANVRLSLPEWMYNLIAEEYGRKRAEAFLTAALETEKPLYIRTVTNRISGQEIIRDLEEEGCEAEPANDNCYKLKTTGSPVNLKAFKNGLIFVQDPGSVMAAKGAVSALKEVSHTDCDESPLIIDVCAAPGGKATFAAEHIPKARVIARDISKEKIALIEENTLRLQLANIRTQLWDATIPDLKLAGKADLVIADLPCSGLGTIGSKPDIRLRVKPEDISSLASLQRRILAACAGYVKEGGILAYSTCTVTPQENRENAAWFEQEFPFNKLSETQLLPDDGTDGFYFAIFKRTNG